MTDSYEPNNAEEGPEPRHSEENAGSALTNLAILPTPTPARETRPITNLGKVFGQFADLQQQIGEQVVALELSVHHQKQDVAAAMSQLPELRDRINWLVANFYEQSKQDDTVRDRLDRQEAAIESLAAAVRSMHEENSRWKAAFVEIVDALGRAKAALGGH